MAKIDLQASGMKSKDTKSQGLEPKKRGLKLILAALAFTLVLVVINPSAIISAAYNNLGSIKLSKALLSSTGLTASGIQSVNLNSEARILIEQARNRLNRALAWDIRNANVYTNLGLLYLAQGDLAAAEKAFLKSSEFSPDDKLVCLHLGDVYEAMGEKDKAIAFWRTTRGGPLFLTRADYFLRQGDLERATMNLKLAAECTANFPEHYHKHYYLLKLAQTYSDLAKLYKEAGKIDQAIEAYRQALEIDPNMAEYQILLALTYKDKGMVREAIKELEEAARTEYPGPRAWAYGELGKTYQVEGELNKAIMALRKAIELEPDHIGYRLELAMTLRSAGMLLDAYEEYKRALEIQPDNDFAKEQIEKLKPK